MVALFFCDLIMHSGLKVEEGIDVATYVYNRYEGEVARMLMWIMRLEDIRGYVHIACMKFGKGFIT